ncbi:MAG: O-antigen ligase family protein [Phycisphaerales bacterium]
MTDTPREPETRATPLAWIAAALIALAALVRAGVTWTPFPHWDGDPFTQGGALVAIGPAMMIALDLAACAGAAIALAASPRVSRLGAGLFAIGAAGVLIHIARSVEHAGLGSAWIAALACGVGAWHLGQFTAVRRALTAAAFGFVGLLLAKGALQYFVEHPQTVAHFRETRDAFFQARGWEPDSRSALIYERRLMQPAATGWFGLSNVFATFMAAATSVFGIAGARAIRTATARNAALVLLFSAIVCAAALAMTGSKGAWAAAALGLIVGCLTLVPAKTVRRGLPWALAAIPLATLAAVFGRGLIGERLGELSVLFRSYYLEGAARVFAGNPLVGVGPAGFKDAYVLARPPLSPEEVTSSHAVLIDWVATLGLFGVAWAALLLLVGWITGRERMLSAETPSSDDQSARLFTLGVAVLVVAFSGIIEREAITPESAAMRAGGLVAWLAIAWAVTRAISERGMLAHAACVGGIAAMLAHAQLDLAAVSETAAPLFMLWVGCLVGGSDIPRQQPGPLARWASAATTALAAVLLGALALPPIARWEGHLRDAAEPASIVADTNLSLQSAATPARARMILEQAAAPLGVSLQSAGSVRAAFGRIISAAQDAAAADLERALAARPHHYGTRTALSRVLLQRAQTAPPDARRALNDRAVAIAEGGTTANPDSASAWMWAGTVHAGLAEQAELDPARRADHLRSARAFWESAADLDPRGPSAPARLMAVCETLGDLDAARAWAQRALQADANMRLDPLKQLTPSERAMAERLTSGG